MLSRGFLSGSDVELKLTHMHGIAVMHNAHIHTQWELYFCPENIMQSSVINGEEYIYKYPCAILTSPYSVHSMSCLETENTDYERYVCYFGNSTQETLGSKLLPNGELDARQGILFELDGGIAEYLKRIFEFMRDEKYPHTQTQKALILGFIVNKLFELCNESKITKVGESSFYIQSVIRHISENLSKTLNANDIAKRFSVSRSKLDRDFKSAVGMTLHDFEDICRLNYAKTLLRSDKKVSVAEISEACGLKNETYFYAFFKKYTGMSPTDYRKTFVSASGKSANEREIDFDPCGEI